MLRNASTKLRGRSLAELRDRSVQLARATAERLGLSPDMSLAIDSSCCDEIEETPGRSFSSPSAALDSFRERAPRRFFAGTADVARTVKSIRESSPAAASIAIALAQASSEGRLRLLGFDSLSYGKPPDWHLDPVSGLRAPLLHWSRVPFLDASVVGDHKVVWELNRHQWLVHVAKAFHMDGDERWAEEALSHIEAWIVANPPKNGINWASSLEIALRSIAWIWVLYLLRDSRALTDHRFIRIVRTLGLAARHVEHNLSTWFSPNTHLTGEALGLLYVGCALPELKQAAKWRQLGMAILAERMPQHVRADGTYREQSTHYARYTLEFLIHAVVLGKRSQMHVPAALTDALRRSARFLRHATRPDGSIPLIGDDDGGRLLFLDPSPPDYIAPTLSVAAAVVGDETLALPMHVSHEEAFWLLGTDAAHAAASRQPRVPEGGSSFFPYGGVATLRDGWNSDSSFAIFDCGPHGMGKGAHAHADLASFDLTLRGRPVIVDPGTWSYVVEGGARDEFRCAHAHAVPLVDGRGSADPGGAFSWMRAPKVLQVVTHFSPGFDLVAVTHDGFMVLDDPVAHCRALVRVRSDYWLVIDMFSSAGFHELLLSYPLAPGLRTTSAGSRALVVDDHGEVARISATPATAGWQVDDVWTSNAYGRRLRSSRLVWKHSFDVDGCVVTLIEPARVAEERAILLATTGRVASVEVTSSSGARDAFHWDKWAGSLTDHLGHREMWTWPLLAITPSGKEAR